jgi:hypothetical protein
MAPATEELAMPSGYSMTMLGMGAGWVVLHGVQQDVKHAR